jgi:hypothetical protein
MWRAALSYLSNTSSIYTKATNVSRTFNVFAIVREYLPGERMACGMDRDSPLKEKSHERTSGTRRSINRGAATLQNIVGITALDEKQKKALKNEGNKCGIHWCSAKEKQSNSDGDSWIMV